jgi:hypothetical protein
MWTARSGNDTMAAKEWKTLYSLDDFISGDAVAAAPGAAGV